MRFAIIGGTNIETPPIPYREETVSTPYGDVVLYRAKLEDDHQVIFLSRHGVLSKSDPGQVNYRANVYALDKIGVTHVIGVTSVGACDYSYKLGALCLISDFIDFTKSRPLSFDREHRKNLHTGMEDVLNPGLNDTLERLITELGIPYSGRATYACSEGPRFETAAEIRALRMLGAQVTGMTLVPEAPLCKDLGLTYAAIGIIANHCTGMTSYVTDEDIGAVMATIRQRVFNLCFELVHRLG
ncbi:MAG: MTAP family purine nucleoside phosphorylase [Clostridia bacterium]